MSGINQATVVGRLGQDIELRFAASGTAVANISVATSEKYKGEEQTEWHRIVCFGKTAELASEHLHKGDLAGFVGKIQTRKWQDQQGNDRYSTEILAREMFFLGSKGTGAPATEPPQQEPVAPSPQEDGFDDIPF